MFNAQAQAQATETCLIERWRGGDRQAGCVLIARYFDVAVAELASYGLGASARAREVFTRVERSLPSLDASDRFVDVVVAHARAVVRDEGRGRGSGPLSDTVDFAGLR